MKITEISISCLDVCERVGKYINTSLPNKPDIRNCTGVRHTVLKIFFAWCIVGCWWEKGKCREVVKYYLLYCIFVKLLNAIRVLFTYSSCEMLKVPHLVAWKKMYYCGWLQNTLNRFSQFGMFLKCYTMLGEKMIRDEHLEGKLRIYFK